MKRLLGHAYCEASVMLVISVCVHDPLDIAKRTVRYGQLIPEKYRRNNRPGVGVLRGDEVPENRKRRFLGRIGKLVVIPLPAIAKGIVFPVVVRSEEHTSELQSRENLVCRLLLEKKEECGSQW